VGEAEWRQALQELEQALGTAAPDTETAPGPERLRALGGALCQRQLQLQGLQEEKDELLGTVAHDLRTPLVAIQGFVQLLQLSAERFGLADKQLEYVERIRQAAQQMNRLVEDLRTARRLEEGRLSIRPAAVALGTFLDDVLSFQREAARQRGLVLESRLEPGYPVTAVFDPDRIAQALGNLVQNAVRVTPEGGQVEVVVSREDGQLLFRVLDSGPGIDPETLPRLFERLTQGRRKRPADRGGGLGLFICYQVAVLHGGRVAARNLPGGGAEFSLELPLVTVREEPVTDPPAEETP
jgi:signal transduction histidine kinase